MKISFKYRVKSAANEWISVEPNSLIQLKEGESYQIKFEYPICIEVSKELDRMGCEKLDDRLYAFRLINFAGELTLSSVRINVQPSKFTADSLSLMLEEISEASSSLLFGWGTPASFEVQANSTENNPRPYHQLQFLRQHMLRADVGNRLQDHLTTIEYGATNDIERHRKPVPLSHVKHLDARAVQKLVSSPAKLAKIGRDSSLYESLLAKKLSFGNPLSRHLSIEVWQPSKQLSFDTPENQFVKHVLADCTNLVNRFVTNRKLHNTMRDDCKKMLSILFTLSGSNFLNGVSNLQYFSTPSQALLKAPGYREVLSFWMQFLQHRSLPLNSDELSDLLEGKNLALLYEYWVFIRVNKAVAKVLGVKTVKKVSVRRDELGESLGHSISVTFNENIYVQFNKSFSRLKGETYSTPFRPDVVLSVNGYFHIFDAKYKMTKASFIDGDYLDEDEDKGLNGVYKRDDLYKMHAYKDAIYNVRSAFVLYPGDATVFFSSNGNKFENLSEIDNIDGVGAIALQPGKDSYCLQTIVDMIVGQ